ncbi:hypothetical protein CONCODRAFT_71939 [Conidiobolus coronatus NRRL 28638]|uniref:NAD(P)-binding protein n=1 Tax=Conidiobolus coronatus (strain ATCC 28846 / CBS 209.66 / NRRL 28638) TaxID=796925 RepID=A0A137P1K4_CONC2|nr:hypothetical protein CONCODRAFT_71939 [Conidiobolus coronatus NRRL 28638]|eukprot:KXN68838.1 hypothetical protein CONCODRAFT_71939 [Conidiobolus coronatus NRRL 28638]
MLLLNHNPIYSTIRDIMNFNSGMELEYTDLTGRLVLVTGEITDTCFQTCLLLTKMSCKLVLANSNKQETLQTIKKLKSLTLNDEIYYSYLNFNNFSNIKQFIQKFSNSIQRLDILINFGCYCEGFDITEDKYEFNLQWNYLGNVVLSLGLVPILKNTKGSRIINVVSNTDFKIGRIGKNIDFRQCNINNYRSTKEHSRVNYYIKLFTRSLSRKLEGISVICVNSGLQSTNFNNTIQGATGGNLISGGYYDKYGKLDQTSIQVQSDELEDELFEHTLKELIGNLDN